MAWYRISLHVLQGVKELLHTKYVIEGEKRTANIRFNRSSYVPGIDTPTAKNATREGEVEVPESKNRFLHRVFATENLYGTAATRVESVMLQGEISTRNRTTYNRIWF